MYDCHDEEFELYSIDYGKPFKVYNSRSDMGGNIRRPSHILYNGELQMD